MKLILLWITFILTTIFWPISLILSNYLSWPMYLLPSIVIIVDYLLIRKKIRYHYFIYLLLPFIHPVLLLFPLVYLIFNLTRNPKITAIFAFLLIFLVVSIFSFKTFYSYSVFTPDPLRFDTLVKKISIIPDRNLARLFENKMTIPFDKYISNIFLTIDLNNYFFSLHPREIAGQNQSLNKFPFLLIFPFIYGLFLLPKDKNRKWIISILTSSIVTISLINNPDKFDFILFIPISYISLIGIKKFYIDFPKIFLILFPFFTLISIFELARVIIF